MGLTAFNSLQIEKEQQAAHNAIKVAESLPKETEVKPDGSNDSSNRKRVKQQ